MQKWEYCVIPSLGWYESTAGVVSLYKLTDKGLDLVADVATIQKSQPKGSRLSSCDVVAQIVAQLGEEGWELASAGTRGYDHDVYFKRPKP